MDGGPQQMLNMSGAAGRRPSARASSESGTSRLVAVRTPARSGLSARTLRQVFTSAGVGCAWSLLAALAHELTAARCILESPAAASAVARGTSRRPDPHTLWTTLKQ